MNAIAKTTSNVPALAIPEVDLIEALKSSLYPGASDSSARMVLEYCKAAGYDPMKKPVHIVPMKVSTGQKDSNGWDIKATRDVIMPGIGQYRTDAVRTGAYAGCSEPEYGPTKTLKFRKERWENGANGRREKSYFDAQIEYPEWCRLTITKLVGGAERQFTAKEFWLENYAAKGDDGAPNAMWEKRPFAQLAKCAEAQALRKAFPDAVGAAPTAEEMEGKAFDLAPAVPVPTAEVSHEPKGRNSEMRVYPAEQFTANFPEWKALIESKKTTAAKVISKVQTVGLLTDEQMKSLSDLEITDAEMAE